jgi:hypothetical protein
LRRPVKPESVVWGSQVNKFLFFLHKEHFTMNTHYYFQIAVSEGNQTFNKRQV